MAIKKLQNNFTTPEQSKRLLELGVPADSADCYIINDKLFVLPNTWKYTEYIKGNMSAYLPCWSVGRLIELHELLFPEIDNFVIEKDDIPLIERMVRYFEICKEELDFSKLED